MFSDDYIAIIRKRAAEAALNHTHEQPWIPEYRSAVAAAAAIVPIEVRFCPRCNAGVCVRCAKCHFIHPLTRKPCQAFLRSDPECDEWKEAHILIQAIIDEDLEHDEDDDNRPLGEG